VQEMLQRIGRPCKPWHDISEVLNKVVLNEAVQNLQHVMPRLARPANALQHFLVLNNQDMDQAMVQFLQAITARQLWANQPEYDCSVVGIDGYR